MRCVSSPRQPHVNESDEAGAVTVTPITGSDLTAVGHFLHEHMNRQIPAHVWSESLQHAWSSDRPNYGFMAKSGETIVGVFCAIYSDQIIDGRSVRFCNPHTWCMLDGYRASGVALALRIVRQHGYQFTMLTPNPNVTEIFRHLGFRNLDDRIVYFPNLPGLSLRRGAPRATGQLSEIASKLDPASRRDLELHRDIPWLRFAAVGVDGDHCLVVYKRSRWKRMPCANILAVSNAASFSRHRAVLSTHLLRAGFVFSRVERRFIDDLPPLARVQRRGQAKLALAPALTDRSIRDLYSELVALDL